MLQMPAETVIDVCCGVSSFLLFKLLTVEIHITLPYGHDFLSSRLEVSSMMKDWTLINEIIYTAHAVSKVMG